MITKDKEHAKEIRDWIDQHVKITSRNPLSPPDKIDILQRMLDELRFYEKSLDTTLPFEEALDWCVTTSDHNLIAIAPPPERQKKYGTGTSSVSMQVRLLVFLLKKINTPQYVHGQMTDFIHEIWNELQPEDFKRLKTGRFRCFTNAGFAATELRNAGFLRCGSAEHHKTWKLSLTGVLTAAAAIQDNQWRIEDSRQGVGSPTNTFIDRWSKKYAGHDEIVESLLSICEPEFCAFVTFEPMLKKVGVLLKWHQDKIESPGILLHEKRKITRSFIDELEGTPGYADFMTELTDSIQLEKLFNSMT